MAATGEPTKPLLKAQEEALRHNERLDTLDLRDVKRKANIDVGGSLVSARVTLTIEGANTLTLGIHDPEWRIERSGLLDKDRNGRLDAVACKLDGLRWRLAQASRNDAATLDLTFEEEVYALLRAHRKRIASSRGSITRAQFIERLVREVTSREIPFFAPEKGRKQPIKLPEFPDAKPSRGDTGFDKDTRFTIVGVTADARQMREVATSLTVADQLDVPQEGVVRLALIVAGIGESNFAPVMNRGGSKYGGVFQGDIGGGVFKISDTEGMARCFLKGGKGFQAGGAIAAHRQNPDWSPGRIALAVEGSLQNFHGDIAAGTHFYQRHVDEARKIMGEWNGGDGGASTHEVVRVKSYRFTRGLPGQPENSVQAATRLADEVAWRFYALGGVVWFVNDYWLLTRAADLVLEGFDAPGLIGRPSYEWDHRKLAASVTFDVAANAWGLLPGKIVACRSMGPITGRWIVESFEFDLFNAKAATVTLTKPTAPRKEPAPELYSVTVDEHGKPVRDDDDLDADVNVPAGATFRPIDGQGQYGRGWHESTRGVTAMTNTSGHWHWHSGLDYSIPAGTRCQAPTDGVITLAMSSWSDGGMVHFKFLRDVGGVKAGTIIGFGHCGNIHVRAGQKVRAGQHLCDSGNPGGGPHVHFVVLDSETGGGDGHRDPEPTLRALQRGRSH